jgi:xylulokinase
MFLGIDLGTSSVKALLVDDSGRVTAEATAPLTVSRPLPLWSEQDPDAWWHATVAAVRTLPAADRQRVRAMALAGQMHGAVVLGADDTPLRPAILWNDGRAHAECATLEALVPNSRAVTGNCAMPGFTAPKLLWLRANEPEIFARTRAVLLPKDYLRLKLTGDKVSDMSDAAGTLWLDVGERRWSEAMLAACDLDRTHMPRLVEGTAISGLLTAEAAAELGVQRIAVAGGSGDNAAAAIGMGIIAPGRGLLSLGTSGVIFLADDRYTPNPERGVHTFCHALPGRWHRMAVILSAASAIDWAARSIGFASTQDAIAALEPPSRHDPLFLPYLSGERTPHNDARAVGAFYGLTHETTRAGLIRAALEGVAFALADGLDALSVDKPPALVVVGGGARISAWGPILASALGCTLEYHSGGDYGAALGAAVLARLCLDEEGAADGPAQAAAVHTVAPDPALAAQLTPRRDLFQRLYSDLKPASKELHP